MFPRRKKPGSIGDVPHILANAYRRLLGRAPTRTEVGHARKSLDDGATVGLLLRDLATSQEYLKTLGVGLSETGPKDPSEYVAYLYLELLNREADSSGLAHHLTLLADGESRSSLAIRLASSDEHLRIVISDLYPLPDLTARYPERYRTVEKLGTGEAVSCYVAATVDDYSWIEARIAGDGYYDRPGIWGSVVDDDKRRVASLIAALEPRRTLDLGCANGTVVACLAEAGVDAEGIDISVSAIASAVPGAGGRLVQGDVRYLKPSLPYDVVYGLDIFEHVPPSNVPELVEALGPLLRENGLVVANIPAFGEDEIFGTVFDIYLQQWLDSAERGQPFDLLHVDQMGFPLHGHLTWAHTRWWQSQFEAFGFERLLDVERTLQDTYGEAFDLYSPARKSFFVFRKGSG